VPALARGRETAVAPTGALYVNLFHFVFPIDYESIKSQSLESEEALQ
jgi:hypothetical protein